MAPPEALILVIAGPIGRARIPELCARVRRLMQESDAELVLCDVGAVAKPSAVTVEALARLQLTARRLGRNLRLRHPCGELRELLALMGLLDVLPVAEGLGVEPGGETEQREEGGGVEEEGDPPEPLP